MQSSDALPLYLPGVQEEQTVLGTPEVLFPAEQLRDGHDMGVSYFTLVPSLVTVALKNNFSSHLLHDSCPALSVIFPAEQALHPVDVP